MFPENFKCETQVICSVYSSDKENDADVLGAVGASAALMISDIPFDGPIAEVRVGRVDGVFVINPTQTQLETSDMDLVVAGTDDSVVMVEGEGKEVSEADLLSAIKLAHENIKLLCKLQIELRDECGKPKREVKPVEKNEELFNEIKALCFDKLKELDRTVMTKEERHNKNKAIYESVQEALKEKYPEQEEKISEIYADFQYKDMRTMILDEAKRLDGRKTTDIRPITCEVGVMPRNHGSALFTRGETQSLTSLTLGTKMDEQIIDGLFAESKKSFMLHYNFPPFSVGETGRMTVPAEEKSGTGILPSVH